MNWFNQKYIRAIAWPVLLLGTVAGLNNPVNLYTSSESPQAIVLRVCSHTSSTEASVKERRQLLNAIAIVESNNDPLAVGDGGTAIGILQISPIMIDDCNRILGYPEFSLSDRWNMERSRQMANIYFDHYCKDMSLIDKARCWNGGPDGWKQDCTLAYADKIERLL